MAKIFSPKAEREEHPAQYEAPRAAVSPLPVVKAGAADPAAARQADSEMTADFMKEDAFLLQPLWRDGRQRGLVPNPLHGVGAHTQGSRSSAPGGRRCGRLPGGLLFAVLQARSGARTTWTRSRPLLPETESRSLNIWNPGCGKGYETYSLACALRWKYPEARIKIWANDSDLLDISMAPNMVFDAASVPEPYAEFMVKGTNGYTFNQAIRDSIFFEFHDVLNTNPLPPVDLIVCRDLVSFLSPEEQGQVLNDFQEKLKGSGLLILGTNEKAATSAWRQVGSGSVSAFLNA